MKETSRGKRITGIVLVAIVILCVGCVAFGVSKEAKADTEENATSQSQTSDNEYNLLENGVLTVSTTTDNAPFIINSGSSTVGFTKDLLDLVAKRLGLTCKYITPRDSESITDPLVAGTADLVATPTVAQSSFAGYASTTDAYFSVDQCVVVMKSSGIDDVSQLAGKKVAVVNNSVGQLWALNNIDQVHLSLYDSIIYALSALRSGNVDAVVGDYASIKYNCRIKYGNERIINTMQGTEQYCFLVKYGNKALTEAVNKALQEIQESGEYQTLYEDWFGKDNEVVRSNNYRVPVPQGDCVQIASS